MTPGDARQPDEAEEAEEEAAAAGEAAGEAAPPMGPQAATSPHQGGQCRSAES